MYVGQIYFIRARLPHIHDNCYKRIKNLVINKAIKF